MCKPCSISMRSSSIQYFIIRKNLQRWMILIIARQADMLSCNVCIFHTSHLIKPFSTDIPGFPNTFTVKNIFIKLNEFLCILCNYVGMYISKHFSPPLLHHIKLHSLITPLLFPMPNRFYFAW